MQITHPLGSPLTATCSSRRAITTCRLQNSPTVIASSLHAQSCEFQAGVMTEIRKRPELIGNSSCLGTRFRSRRYGGRAMTDCPSSGLTGGPNRERQTQRCHLSMGHANVVPPSAFLVRGRERSVDMSARPYSACPQYQRTRAICSRREPRPSTALVETFRSGPRRNHSPDNGGLVWRVPATT